MPSSTGGNSADADYPEVQARKRNSIIDGASLWVMGGKKADEYRGVAKFFPFLSDVDRQVKLHTESGYLPITQRGLREGQGFGASTRTSPISRPRSSSTDQQDPDRQLEGPALRQPRSRSATSGRRSWRRR